MSTIHQSVINRIFHLQYIIENSQDDENRLIYCLKKLSKLPIKLEHLQETRIGITVGSITEFGGQTGAMAMALIYKWKNMVERILAEIEIK